MPVRGRVNALMEEIARALSPPQRIPGTNVFETMLAIGRQPVHSLPAFLQRLTSRYGAVASFRLPWQYLCFVNDVELIKDVLVTQQHAFARSPGTRTLRLLLGEGLLTSDEPLHRRMRRIVQPAFHRERIERYVRIMQDRAEAFAANVPVGCFDMHAAMTELALSIASRTLFGPDAGDVANEVSIALREIMELLPLALGPIGALRLRLPLRSTRRFEYLRARLDSILTELIEKRRYISGEDADALTMLTQAIDPETNEPLSDQQVRDEAMTLFIAGHETTANALTWTWYLLSRYPLVADCVRRAALDGDDEYLRAVISESLRLYPPAWMIGRRALRGVTIGEYLVPKGATVIMSPLVTQRSAKYFDDPNWFFPERWLRPHSMPQFAYFPFGGGSRRCIGEQFALTEALIILKTVSRRYQFGCMSKHVRALPLVTLRPIGPVYMRSK